MKKKTKKKVLPQIGAYIGCGAYKECFNLTNTNNPKYVALLSRDGGDDQIKYDFQQLRKLTKLKVPVVKASLKKVLLRNGKTVRLAIVCRKYDQGGLRCSGIPYLDFKAKPQMMKNLRKIYNAIKRAKVHMPDMQFLLNKTTGEIVLTDPGHVSHPMDNSCNYNLIDIAKALGIHK